MKLEKKHIGIITIIVLAIIAFFTRKYWMPPYGSIDIKNVDWDNKEVTYQLFLQGESMGTQKVKFGEEGVINAIPEYKSNGKYFTFNITSTNDKQVGDMMGFALFKGSSKDVSNENIINGTAVAFQDKKIVPWSEIKKGLKGK